MNREGLNRIIKNTLSELLTKYENNMDKGFCNTASIKIFKEDDTIYNNIITNSNRSLQETYRVVMDTALLYQIVVVMKITGTGCKSITEYKLRNDNSLGLGGRNIIFSTEMSYIDKTTNNVFTNGIIPYTQNCITEYQCNNCNDEKLNSLSDIITNEIQDALEEFKSYIPLPKEMEDMISEITSDTDTIKSCMAIDMESVTAFENTTVKNYILSSNDSATTVENILKAYATLNRGVRVYDSFQITIRTPENKTMSTILRIEENCFISGKFAITVYGEQTEMQVKIIDKYDIKYYLTTLIKDLFETFNEYFSNARGRVVIKPILSSYQAMLFPFI